MSTIHCNTSEWLKDGSVGLTLSTQYWILGFIAKGSNLGSRLLFDIPILSLSLCFLLLKSWNSFLGTMLLKYWYVANYWRLSGMTNTSLPYCFYFLSSGKMEPAISVSKKLWNAVHAGSDLVSLIFPKQ